MGRKISIQLSRESFEELEEMRHKLDGSPKQSYEDYLKDVEAGKYDAWFA